MKNRIVLGFLISLTFGFGQFPKNGFPIATTPYRDEDPKLARLGNDLIVAYKTFGDGWNQVKVVRINGLTGEIVWEKAVGDDSSQSRHQIVIDNNGKIWIVFVRYHYSPYDAIFLQRFSPDGKREFEAMGLEVSGGEGDRTNPNLCVAGDRVYCAWMDYRSGEANVYLAKISPDGKKEFEVAVCPLPGIRANPALEPSGEGIIIFWGGKEYDTVGVYGNRIIRNEFLWGERGKLILPYPSGSKSFNFNSIYPSQYTATDNMGGAYVFPAHHYESGVQRVDSLGNLLFDSIPKVTMYRSYSITSTEDYGTVGCYPLSGRPYQRVEGVKINGSGEFPWGELLEIWRSPILDTTTYYDPYCSVVGDYGGGCVVAIGGWQSKEERDMIVVHVDSSGDVGKPIIVCDASGDQQNPVIVQNPSTKGYFLLWEDLRNGFTNWDIYGTALDSLLRPGIEERKVSKPVSLLLHSTPNPFSKSLVIKFQLLVEAKVSLKVYDVSGKVVKILTRTQNSEPGVYTLKWDGRDDKGRLLPSGVYFIRFKAADYSKTQKVILFR